VPYAVRNGRISLIKPEVFEPKTAEKKAMKFGYAGRLLFTHPDEEGEKRQLVVVSAEPSVDAEIEDKLARSLEACSVRFVRSAETDAYADEVRKTSH
jgi:hypothetical protein